MAVVAAVLATATFGGSACGESSGSEPSGRPRSPDTRLALRTFVVSPRGNDRAAGSLHHPWRTLGLSLARLRPGDQLLVRGGQYRERIKLRAPTGRPDARITVRALPGERPVVVGQLWLGDASYWTLDGINVTWAAGNPTEPMMRMYGGTGWIVRGAEISGAHSTSALHVDDGPRNDLGAWQVVGNCIHDTHPTDGANQDNNIYVDDMSRSRDPRGLIERNIVFNAPNGRGIKFGPGGTEGGPRNVVVRHNTLFGNVVNISVSRATSNIEITRNLLYEARSANLAAVGLRGPGNHAYDNVAGRAPRFVEGNGADRFAVQRNHSSVQLGFDRVSCSGFHPSAWQEYGRYG
jgi:hypothetical protein